MMKAIRLSVLALGVALLAPAMPAWAQGYVANAPDPYVHKSVGVAMPAQAAGLTRTQVAEYNADGSDAGATYFAADEISRFSLYIYPTRGMSCDESFNGAKAAIDQHRGSKLQKKAEPIVLDAFTGSEQRSAQYAIPANGYGAQHPELKSELWLACVPGGEWFVKYRGSYLADDESFEGIAARFIAAFDWTPLLGEAAQEEPEAAEENATETAVE